jgi:RNA recognition motif-containing protein
MYGDGRDMSAIVKFDSKESCKKAYSEAQGLLLFGNKLKVTPVDRDDFPAGGRDIQVVPPGPGSGGMLMGKAHPTEDIDPQATHSLFVGNIPKNISVYELKDIFQRFGDVVVSQNPVSLTCSSLPPPSRPSISVLSLLFPPPLGMLNSSSLAPFHKNSCTTSFTPNVS